MWLELCLDCITAVIGKGPGNRRLRRAYGRGYSEKTKG